MGKNRKKKARSSKAAYDPMARSPTKVAAAAAAAAEKSILDASTGELLQKVCASLTAAAAHTTSASVHCANVRLTSYHHPRAQNRCRCRRAHAAATHGIVSLYNLRAVPVVSYLAAVKVALSLHSHQQTSLIRMPCYNSCLTPMGRCAPLQRRRLRT
jgi:hypothetical protein